MFKFQGIILFSENPAELVEFYSKVIGQEPDWSGGEFKGYTIDGCEFAIGPHDKVKGKNTNPERIMFNLETDDVKGEFDRIKQLGANVVAEPYHPGEEPSITLATFEDPDGNYFQIGSPMGGK